MTIAERPVYGAISSANFTAATWDWHAVAWTKAILGLPTVPGFTFTRV